MSVRIHHRPLPAVAMLLLLTTLFVALPTVEASAAGPTVVIASGNNQSVVVGKTFGQMKVQVIGASGPQATTLLKFVVTGDATFAGGYTSNTIYTDSLGYAAPSAVHAGSEPGPITVEVRLADGQVGAVFSGTVLPDPSQALALRVVSGDGQSVAPGADLEELVVVAERGRVPVSGVEVTFTVVDPEMTGTSFAGAPTFTTTTATDGRAKAQVRGGDAPGSFTIRADSEFGGSTISGQISAADAPWQLQAVEGDDQSTTINTPFPHRLVFRMTDDLGRPVAGRRVDFVIGNGLASFEGNAISAYAYSGEDGTAFVPVLYANSTPGATSVIATAEGTSGPSRIERLYVLVNRSA